MKDLATSDSLCKKIACSPFLRVRLVTIYFAKNWKHCNKIIFKYMKNYCLLYFLLFISLKLLFMDNEQYQTRNQEKKKFFLKTRKEAKRGRDPESKPTLSQYLAIHWNFSYFNLKVIIFYLLLLLLLFIFFFCEEAMSTQINNIWFSKVKITICQILKSHAASTALLCKC